MTLSLQSFTEKTFEASARAEDVVLGLATELADGGELEPLLERFLVSIMALAGAQAGAVRVLSEDGTQMRLIGQLGLPAKVLLTERLVGSGCGKCGAAIESDALCWIDDLEACARHNMAGYFGPRCRRVLAISLSHGGNVLGIYNLFFEHDARLDGQTESILRLIGQLLGLSLYNARLGRERLRSTVLRERQEMVSEVHDAIAQTLYYVKMRLPLLNDAMLEHDDQRSLKYFGDVKKAVIEAHENLREVMTYFRTRMDPLGLMHALQRIRDSFFDRTGIVLEVNNSVPKLSLTDEQELQVFHIVQEALANIAKHSMANTAMVTIVRSSQGLEFIVEDDGLGMNSPSVATIVTTAQSMAAPGHLGLEIMQTRASMLGGTVEVGMKEGGGTRVRLLVPEVSTARGTVT